MIEGNIYKIKYGRLDQWRNWCSLLMGKYNQEALETLKEEKVLQEAFLIFKLNEEYYSLGLGEGEFLPSTNRELNLEHIKQSRECLQKITAAECLYHLKCNIKI